MLRAIYILGFIFGLLCLCSFRPGNPFPLSNPLIYNTTLAQIFHEESREAPAYEVFSQTLEVDTTSRRKVLMLDYSSYGSAYNEKIRVIIQKYLPNTIFTDFAESSADGLANALRGCEVAIVAYPSAMAKGTTHTFNKALTQFVQQGGTVIFTGTHEFEVLQQFGLIDLDFGYYSKERPIHPYSVEHPILKGLGSEISLVNFSYPLDIPDPAFIPLADVDGYPVVGYKPIGTGQVIYIGVEYYFDEAESSHLLVNAISWSDKDPQANSPSLTNSSTLLPKAGSLNRNEEMLFAGTGMKEQVDLKIYPNPYYNKATLDIELTKPTPVYVEMTDELGRVVALVFPKKTIGPGLCRFELPNINPGIYFLQIQVGSNTTVRKVVKSSAD